MRDFGNGAIVLGNAINRDHPLNRGLQGHWIVLPGSSGGRRFCNIALTGAASLLTSNPIWSSGAGRPGGKGSLVFDGVDDYVNCGTVSKAFTKNATGLTASVWLKTTSTSRVVPIGVYSGSSTMGFGMDINRGASIPEAGKIYAYWRGNGSAVNSRYTTNATDVNNGNWHHVVTTSDYGTGTDAQIYIDGIKQSVTAVATNTLTPVALSHNIFIGSLNSTGSPSDFFPGSLDDVRFYSRKLAEYEVWQLYNESRRGYPTMLNRLSPLRTFYFGTAAGAPPSSTFDVIGGGCGQFMIGAD